MVCFECYEKMIEIDLNIKGRTYKAGYCIKCGRFITSINEKKIWSGGLKNA